MKEPISVIIITQNEEQNIHDCLASVRWCEEIILVDAFSSDQTVAISKQFTDRIFQQEWQGFAEQKSFALAQAHQQWVLSLDADERVTPELQSEICSRLHQPDLPDGFHIPRKSYFLGKWIKHSGWYPGYQLRLFYRAKTRVSQKRVHEGFIVDGRVEYLQNPILHFTHPTIADSLQKMDRYSSLEAEDRAGSRKVRWYDLVFHPVAAFLRKYFVQKGFLDGMHGFVLALITAQLKMALYMKMWEQQQPKEKAR